MVKIICMINNYAPLIYFVNAIHERHKVSLVLMEGLKYPPVYPFDALFWFAGGYNNGSLIQLTNNTKRRVESSRLFKLYQQRWNRKHVPRISPVQDYDRFFGEKWRLLSGDIPVVNVDSINSSATKKILTYEKPDILLDHGTSLVKNDIIRTVPLALNLHWGLSPYYRGSLCTQWALINRDPYNIGVTIHKLSDRIDGGDILAQKRATIKVGDTVNSINMQLTKLGTEIMLKAIQQLETGRPLIFHKQDLSEGLFTNVSHLTPPLRAHVRYLESNPHAFEDVLRKPGRKSKPLVEGAF